MTLSSSRPLRAALLATAFAAACLPSPLEAQDRARARVPVRLVEDKLLVECDLSTKFRRLPVNLFVDYDSPCELQLHNQAAAGLKCETRSGETFPITVHLGGFEVTVEKREHGDQDFYDEFTKYNSAEMGEKAAVGTIGAELLSRYFVVFDLGNGLMEIGPPKREDPNARDSVEGMTVVPITEINGLAWLPVRHSDRSPGALAIGTSRYDTLVDTAICERWDRPAGNLPSLLVGELELSELVAFRPEEVIQVHPDGVVGQLGLGLLKSFRIEIDRVNRVARLEQTRPAEYPLQDFEFFEARLEEEAEPLAAYLEKWPDERLSREAAALLLEHRLDEGSEAEACRAAIECLHRTYPEDLRATAMGDLMKMLVEAEHPGEAVIAGDLGVESGRKDRYPNAVHELHGKLGELLLDEDPKRAWKHLLSAAFGLPDDGPINLNLGRFYERDGRHRRAFSRYVQAVIKPDSGPAALEALHRLQQTMTGEERLSIERIETLIGGKVHGFGAATLFHRPPLEENGRVVLVEFFTNANYGDATRGGSIGGALGNDGLVSHFSNKHAAFITYQLDQPEMVPMITEVGLAQAATYGVGPNAHIINGRRRGPGAGKWRDKEKIYNACREAVVAELGQASEFEIEAEITVEDGELFGFAEVYGPDQDNVIIQAVLVERGVLFPGRSEVVIHRNVARAYLTEDVRGEPYFPLGGMMRVDFECSLSEVAEENSLFLDRLAEQGAGSVLKMSMELDPAQLGVVVIVRDRRNRGVLQAAQVWVEPPAEKR